MKIKKTIIILSVLMLFLLIAGVSANDINTTDEISTTNDVDENIESSTINPEVIEEDLNDNSDNKKLEYSYEDNLSDEGEFIDVNDAYVYLNQFRNETGVWQWNNDDTTKTVFNTNESNQLKPLARDLNLEETAKIRAKELVEKWGHERPDGTMCFTAFPDGFNAKGENIASGQTSANEVTDVWKETNDPYSGQGHRRNMLSSMFNCVGIAGYKLNGVIYWVQDFGYTNNINEGEIIYPNTNNNSNTQNEEENNTKNKGTFTELNELIQNASENSVIKLDNDYSYDNYTDSDFKKGINITKMLTIEGQGHTIDTRKSGRTLYLNEDGNVILKNINFVNGYFSQGAGSIYNRGNCSFMNCTFINNSADSGGVICNHKYVSFTNCTFINNSASSWGGVIDNDNDCHISSCNFINNIAMVDGGAIENIGDCYIINSKFINNIAMVDGGAIDNTLRAEGTIFAMNCTFINNIAMVDGGAIHDIGKSSVVNCSFINNSANSTGGAIRIEERSSVENSNFINNHAKEGDAIYISRSKTTNIINSKFINNNMPKDHLFISGNDFIIDYSNLINKTGVDIKLENITILNCTFEKTDIINSTSNKNQNNAIINKDDNINSNPTINKKATKITAKKKTFKAKTKTKKYTITLKAGKKAVKKVKVYLKIGKKTFKATTNKNGKATFKIKLNKKGTYKSKITFKGSKIYKATTKKVTIKIK